MKLIKPEKFKVGDVVMYTGKGSNKGKIGTIDYIESDGTHIYVVSSGRSVFDKYDFDDCVNMTYVTYKTFNKKFLKKVEW